MDSNRDQIEEIKGRLDIVDIVNKYVALKQSGKNFSGKCPFHLEKTPSFIVSPELQRYKCFGCGESGDIFNFIQKIESIDFPEALQKLAKEAGVQLRQSRGNSQYQRLEEINRKAAIYYFKQLKENKTVLKYLYDRSINDDGIQSFGVGYAPGVGLLNYLQKGNKYSKQELLLSGLFVEKENRLREKFFKRVMFPIRSSSGKVIAFTGRILPQYEYGPKYMNSPETPIYHKKENVYGQYESRQEARKQDLIVICEGTTDVISAHQIGIKNIVAPLGTALTSEQLSKISKLSKNIYFLFDSDMAGQMALEKAFILAQPLKLNTYANSTAPYKDIDEMINSDAKAFKKLVSKRIDAYTYMLTEKIKEKNLNKFSDYEKVVSWMRKMLGYVVDPNLKSFYVKVGVNITKIDPLGKGSNTTVLRPRKTTWKSPLKKGCKKGIFLQSILYLPKIKLPKYINLNFFDDVKHRNILEYIDQNPACTREDILSNFENDPEIRALLEDSIFTFSQDITSEENIKEIYDNIVREYYQDKEREYTVKIASAESRGDIQESQKLLEEFQNLTKEKKQYEQNSRLR